MRCDVLLLRLEHDLAQEVPVLEFAVGGLHVAERVGVGDWDLQSALIDQLGELSEHLGVGGRSVSFELDAVLLDRQEVDDRVDPLGADA